MAFCNKLGSLVRQSISQNWQVRMASVLNSLRCMSSSKLFIGGLPWSTDDQTFKDAFANFGEVTYARVVTDRDTGRSRGFGFVSFETSESASEALSAMDGQDLEGRNIHVSYATERKPNNYSYSHSRNQGYENRVSSFPALQAADALNVESGTETSMKAISILKASLDIGSNPILQVAGAPNSHRKFL